MCRVSHVTTVVMPSVHPMAMCLRKHTSVDGVSSLPGIWCFDGALLSSVVRIMMFHFVHSG